MAGATGDEAIGRATYLFQGHGRISKFFQEQIEQAARESPWYEIGPSLSTSPKMSSTAWA